MNISDKPRLNQRKRQATSSPVSSLHVKKRVTNSIADLEKQLDELRKIKGRSPLSKDATILVLHCYYAWTKRVKSTSSTPANACNTVSELLGISKQQVSKILKQWTDNTSTDINDVEDRIRQVSKPGNRLPKKSRVPRSDIVYNEIQSFIKEKESNKERITSVQILQFLISKGHMTIKLNDDGNFDQKDYDAAVRSVQRYLQTLSSRQRKRDDALNLEEQHF